MLFHGASDGIITGGVIDNVVEFRHGRDVIEEGVRILVGVEEAFGAWRPSTTKIQKGARRKPREVRVIQEVHVGWDEVG
jgi:hypothetical protein